MEGKSVLLQGWVGRSGVENRVETSPLVVVVVVQVEVVEPEP